jgi:probable F420-dependent oxidoreductase
MAELRIGCDLPYFADPVQVRDFAQGVEELGFAHLAFSEHVAASGATDYPPGFAPDDPWHESMTLAAFLAGVTSRIELNPAVLLLVLRPVVLAAKQAAEVDLLSGGRLRIAVSVGWNREEVAALGADPARRGALLEEQIPLLRRLWAGEEVSADGPLVVLDRVGIHPPAGRPIPLWIGGGGVGLTGRPAEAALDRAARLADGFKMMAPLGADPDLARRVADDLRERAARHGRDPGSLGLEARILVQATTPEQWVEQVGFWREQGATHIGLTNRIVGGGVDDQLALVRRFAEETGVLDRAGA